MTRCTGWYRGHGVAFFRVFGYGLSLKSPESSPLFSERNGFNPPLIKLRGWRLFTLKPGGI